MFNGITFCIFVDPALQAVMPLYTLFLVCVTAACTASLILSRSGITVAKKIFVPRLLSNKKVQVSLVLILQLAILGSFQSKYNEVVRSGRQINLLAKAADPVDFFRGNYQALSYSDNELNSKKVHFHSMESAIKDSIVFVAFKKSGQFWRATDIYASKPDDASDAQRVVIKARVTSQWENNVTVNYGIQQYYFAEGKGVSMQNGAVATIKVDSDGDAVLTNLTAANKNAID